MRSRSGLRQREAANINEVSEDMLNATIRCTQASKSKNGTDYLKNFRSTYLFQERSSTERLHLETEASFPGFILERFLRTLKMLQRFQNNQSHPNAGHLKF